MQEPTDRWYRLINSDGPELNIHLAVRIADVAAVARDGSGRPQMLSADCGVRPVRRGPEHTGA